MVLKPLDDELAALVARLRASFARELPHQLTDPLRDLDPDVALLALAGADPGARPALLPGDRGRLDACANGPLPYDLVVRPAFELVSAAVVSGTPLPPDDARLLVMKVLEKRPWDEVTEALALGTVAFAGLGLLMAGTLRAEATLALANLLFLVALVVGGIVVPLDRLPDPVASVAGILPPALLDRLLEIGLGAGGDPGGVLALLAGWAVLLAALAAWRFRLD